MTPKIFRMEISTDGQKVAARLVRDSKRRLNATNLGKLQKLFAERSRWQRKHTIASNKLARVQRAIDAHAEVMAKATLETDWQGGAK